MDFLAEMSGFQALLYTIRYERSDRTLLVGGSWHRYERSEKGRYVAFISLMVAAFAPRDRIIMQVSSLSWRNNMG